MTPEQMRIAVRWGYAYLDILKMRGGDGYWKKRRETQEQIKAVVEELQQIGRRRTRKAAR